MSYASDGYIALWNLEERRLEWSTQAHRKARGIHVFSDHQGDLVGGRLNSQAVGCRERSALNSAEGGGCDLSQYEDFPVLHHGQRLSLSDDGIPRVREASGSPCTILRGMTPGHLSYGPRRWDSADLGQDDVK